MAIHDFRSQRLFVDGELVEGRSFDIPREQANYLLNVLRLNEGAQILVFNGRDGEWLCAVHPQGRKKCFLEPMEQVRPQPSPFPLTYCFAPLKQARLDYMIQKAIEMGVGVLQPVITEFTQVRTVNEKRVLTNAIEAAEQCGILSLPEIRDPVPLTSLRDSLTPNTQIVFCDESAGDIQLDQEAVRSDCQVALLIGPEGGFSNEEREMILKWPDTLRLGLGPRILRADTAAVAALTIVQSSIGDWQKATNKQMST